MNFSIAWLMGYLIYAVVFGCITDNLAKSKGYESGFAWGFLLGFVGLLVVGFRPVKAVEEKVNEASSVEIPVKGIGTAIVNPKGGSIPMYDKPDYDVQYWIPSKTNLLIVEMEEESDWAKVWYCGDLGYVKKAELRNFEMKEIPEEEEKTAEQQTGVSAKVPDQEIMDKLLLLKKLHDEGLLTDGEFSRKKAEIIDNI